MNDPPPEPSSYLFRAGITTRTASTDFSDLYVWGVAGLVLAAMAWRGSVEKRKSDALDQEQRDHIATLARAAEANQQAAPPSSQ